MEISIELTEETKALIAKISSNPRLIANAQKEGLKMGSEIFSLEAKQKVPVKTGNLKRNILTEFGFDQAKIWVDPRVEYAPYVEYGTRPHTIRPVRKRVLADKKKGIIFGTIVHHPGTKGRFFMKAGANKVQNQMKKISEKIYNVISEGLGL